MGVIDDTYLSYEIEQSIIDLTQKYVTRDIICQYKGRHCMIAWDINAVFIAHCNNEIFNA